MRSFNRIAAAVAAAFLGANGYAQSSVTIYGVMDAAIEVSNHGAKQRLVSGGNYGSRLGFRGSEDLGGGLGAVFRLEMGVNADSGSLAQGGLGFGRESSVGLQSRTWGTLLLGRVPTPLYVAQSATDPFNWMGSGGHLALTRDNISGAPQQVLPLTVNARLDNSATYISPVFAGFQFRGQASLAENAAAVGSSRSASLKYTAGPLDANIAWQSLRAGVGGTGHARGWTVGGSYDFGIARVFAGATEEENNCSTCIGALARGPAATSASTSKFRLLNIGARAPFGSFTLIGEVARIQDRSAYFTSPGDRDATLVSMGGEYGLSKRTVLYGSLGTIDNRNGSRYALGTGSSQQIASAWPAGSNKRASTLNLGIRHVF